jgi:hypothetical protein
VGLLQVSFELVIVEADAREYVLAKADSRTCLQRLFQFYESVVARSQQERSLC